MVALAAKRDAPGGAPSSSAASRTAPAHSGVSPRPAASSPPEPSAEVMGRGPSQDEGCSVEDRGDGGYREHDPGVMGARLFALPKIGERFDVLVHFHGGEPARRLLAPAGLDLVLVTVDAGVGSQRYAALMGPKALDALLAAVDERLAPAGRRHLIVSSWSAGFGAVRELLAVSPATPRAVVLLDSVHTSYTPGGGLDEAGLTPFFALAERAVRQEQIMVLTHSAIVPPGYASTSEVAAAIVGRIGGRPRYAGLVPEHGVEQRTRFDRGTLHVLGTTGNGKAAHCAHLKMLPALLASEVMPRL